VEKESQEYVLLIHGLAAPSWMMRPLARVLRAGGFSCLIWDYASLFHSLEYHADRLARLLETLDEDSKVRVLHLATHSMGGVLARLAIAQRRPSKLGRIAMLAPPNHGSHAARRLAPALGRICPPLVDLSDDPGSLARRAPWPSDVEIGVIAANWDWVVRPESTRPPTPHVFLTLPGTHATLPLLAETLRQACAFLKNGKFEPAPSSCK
jgi:pimeloyl-ACP methyl ester carboxylesterase